MLISVVMDPACIAPEQLGTAQACAGAERLMEAVSENAVLVAQAIDPFVNELIDCVERLDARSGQDLQLAVAEIAKSRVRHIAVPQWPMTVVGGTHLDRLRHLAQDMRADVVLVPNAADVKVLANLASQGIEVCTLSGYRASKCEAKRRTWRAAQRLDNMHCSASSEILGRSIMYANEIVILDKMIARSGKDGYITAKLRRFARGVVHVVDQWSRYSPLSGRVVPSIAIVSSAGGCGASAGFVDPTKAETAVRAAIAEQDKNHVVGKLLVDLRQESTPPVFNDRFLAGFNRCWSVTHGFDDIGNLAVPRIKKGPTTLAPDCQAYRDILADIRLLPRS